MFVKKLLTGGIGEEEITETSVMKFNNSHILSVAGLIVALSIAYYLVIFLPHKEQEKINLQKQMQIETESKRNVDRTALNTCLDAVNNAGYENWNKYCETEGLKKDCNLPNYQSEKVNNYTKELKDECFKKYPQ